MTAATPVASEPKPQFVPTADGCHVNPAAIFLGANNRVELIEWAPDDLVPNIVTFDEAQELAAKCSHAGGGWHVAVPHEWTGTFDYMMEAPASALPGLKSAIYWTGQPDPSSSGVAFAVRADIGLVLWLGRLIRFRVRFCRRVPASQFLTLGL